MLKPAGKKKVRDDADLEALPDASKRVAIPSAWVQQSTIEALGSALKFIVVFHALLYDPSASKRVEFQSAFS